jgi:hypothetical protein
MPEATGTNGIVVTGSNIMSSIKSDWQTWRDLFQGRADRPLQSLDADLDYKQLPRSMARTLAVFQLGESGGGNIIRQARQSRLSAIDDHYAEAVDMFVSEERRHASQLAVCVRMMGGELIRRNWAARLFVLGRRLFGLRFKVLVLLAAEVVGLSFYRLIATRLPPCRLRDTVLQIVGDKHSHMNFHCAFLKRQATTPFRRALFKASWRALTFCVGVVAPMYHRQALRDLSIEFREFQELWSHYRLAAEIQMFGLPRTWTESDELRSPSRCA